MDCSAVLLVRDAFHHRLWTSIRTSGGRAGAGPIRIDYLPLHGAHASLRARADLCSGDHHHADT